MQASAKTRLLSSSSPLRAAQGCRPGGSLGLSRAKAGNRLAQQGLPLLSGSRAAGVRSHQSPSPVNAVAYDVRAQTL